MVARSDTIPDGSYFSHSAPGTTGSSTKLSTIAIKMSSTMAATCFGERSRHPYGRPFIFLLALPSHYTQARQGEANRFA